MIPHQRNGLRNTILKYKTNFCSIKTKIKTQTFLCSNKTPFYSYYRLLIIPVDKALLTKVRKLVSWVRVRREQASFRLCWQRCWKESRWSEFGGRQHWRSGGHPDGKDEDGYEHRLTLEEGELSKGVEEQSTQGRRGTSQNKRNYFKGLVHQKVKMG